MTDQHTDIVGTFPAGASSLSGDTAYSPLGAVIPATGMSGKPGFQSGWTGLGNGRVHMLDQNGVQVNVFEHDGQLVAVNNRSLAALILAGLEPTNINILDEVPAKVLARLPEGSLVGSELPSSMIAVTPSVNDLRVEDIIQRPGG
jgi:hypothetical protein